MDEYFVLEQSDLKIVIDRPLPLKILKTQPSSACQRYFRHSFNNNLIQQVPDHFNPIKLVRFILDNYFKEQSKKLIQYFQTLRITTLCHTQHNLPLTKH
jgi:hypothetical protein